MTGSAKRLQIGSAGKNRCLPISLLIALGFLMILPRLLILPSQNPKTLFGYFDRHARVELIGSREDTLLLSSDRLAGYLAFITDSPQLILNGEEAFSEKELTHLSDVRALYRLAGLVCIPGAVLLLLSVVLAYLKTRTPRLSLRLYLACLQTACVGLLSLAVLLVFLALLDFTELFHAFHRLVFTNELWLLDPHEDLLIQLMPEPFFTDYLKRTMLPVFAALLVLSLPTYKLFDIKKEPPLG